MIHLIHTADWQIGKPFGFIADAEKRSVLRRERIAAIERIGEVARSRNAACVLVAGDVFDSNTVDDTTVSDACSAIRNIGIPVLAIPGNHDHGGEGSIWNQPYFRAQQEKLAPNLRLLDKPEPVDIEGLRILPCPLMRRQDTRDATAWIQDSETPLTSEDRPTVVLAHGTVAEFGSREEETFGDSAPNHIQLDRLKAGAFDYIALGDWHGAKQVESNAWYAGTPEQDRFAKGSSNDPGHVLAVSLEKGQPPKVEKVSTSRIGWHTLDVRFDSDENLSPLTDPLAALIGTRSGRDLLQLKLSGNLALATGEALEAELASLRGRLLELRLDHRVTVLPDQAEIDALAHDTANPLIARVATVLARGADDDPSPADESVRSAALRKLFTLAAATPKR
ncbi:MAG: metallophosphoesterase family protein [Opitutales bacterium]